MMAALPKFKGDNNNAENDRQGIPVAVDERKYVIRNAQCEWKR